MRKWLVAGAVAACAAVGVESQVGAQQGPGGGGRGLAAGGTIAGTGGYPTPEQYAASKDAQEYVAKAKAIAGSDTRLLMRFENTCGALGPQRPALEAQNAGQKPAPPAVMQPVRIFDNLWYFGFNTVGAWAVRTSGGIILIDALNTVQEAETIVEPALRQAGLNPADVTYVIVGHGHFDHFGGVPYFQDKYKARVAMSALDWDFIERPNPNANPAQASRPRPKRDIAVTDGQKITVGDTTITLMVTPGHTVGSLAFLIPVTYQGKPLTALMLSGANITPDRATLNAFTKALDSAKAAGAQALFNGHPGLFGDELGWMDALRKNPKGPNEFVYSKDQFGKFIDIMKACAASRVVAMGL
ncbi:MAG: MBL fold metallo-hydrolase [Acidobacteria bacterium]|nr:MBL fold metallo-hydrolase [Acidobacteriota bacterium]